MKIISPKDQALIQLGRAQMAEANIQVNTYSRFKALAEVKKSKSYKGLTILTPAGKLLKISTFEQFCTDAVGMSRAHVDNNIRLLEQLGDEGFEAAQIKQIGYRDMVKISRLPADLKEEAVQALVDTDDKEAILEVVEDLAVRNRELQQSLESHEQETEAEMDKMRSTNADLQMELDTEQSKVGVLKNRLMRKNEEAPFPELVMVTRQESAAFSDEALCAINSMEHLHHKLRDNCGMVDKDILTTAYNNLHTHAKAVFKHALGLITQIEAAADTLLRDIEPHDMFDEEELQEFVERRDLIILEHQQQQKLRKLTRERNKKKGPGRPRKEDQ